MGACGRRGVGQGAGGEKESSRCNKNDLINHETALSRSGAVGLRLLQFREPARCEQNVLIETRG
jgi:hypothetical protein